MYRHTTAWHNGPVAREFVPSDPLRDAIKAHERAKKALKNAKEKLAQLAAEEVRSGAKLTDVAKATGYSDEHVRRLARAHGVEGDPSRIPPPAPPRRKSSSSDH
jgi:hypothetical protein